MEENCKEQKQKQVRKTYRDAKIKVVANGFVIEIGCQTLVAHSPEHLYSLIGDYLNNPQDTEKRIMLNSFKDDRPEAAPGPNLFYSQYPGTLMREGRS